MKAKIACLFIKVPICILFLQVTSLSLATEPPVKNISVCDYYLQFLTFKAEQARQTVLELFCEYPVTNLRFIQKGVDLSSRYELAVTLYDENRCFVDSLTLSDSVFIRQQDEFALMSATRLQRFVFSLAPGEYIAQVEIRNGKRETIFTYEQLISIADYSGGGLQISDLQLSTNEINLSSQSIPGYNRNRVLPNLSNIFGIEHKILYVYSEIYNLNYKPGIQAGDLVATYTIFDMNMSILLHKKHRFTKPGRAGSLNTPISVANLPTGAYKLLLDIRDPETSERQYKETIFHVINPWLFISHDSYLHFVRQLCYIAEKDEIKKLSTLQADQYETGLRDFWKKRDPFPTTVENEFMQTYLTRVYLSNRYFEELTRDGWETEQGETYIVNGPPDNIGRVVSVTSSKLYEIWTYNNLQRKFVFVDNWGLGSFQLIKSTKLLDPVFSLH